MNIATMFQRKRALKAEVIRPFQEQYFDDIVRPLARFEEIDEARVFEITDKLGIDEAKLSKDVSTQQERFQLAKQLSNRNQANEEIAELSQAAERLDAEHRAFMDKWQPKRKAVFEKLRAAELVLLQTMHIEGKLIETVLDPVLIERTKELEAKRHKVAAEMRDLQQEVTDLRNRISYAKAMVDNVHLENSRMPLAFGEERQNIRDKYKAHQVKLAQEKYADEQRAAQPTFDKYDRLKAEQQKLDDEIRELNKLKLVP